MVKSYIKILEILYLNRDILFLCIKNKKINFIYLLPERYDIFNKLCIFLFYF